MAHDAPPGRELPQLIDPQARDTPTARPRLVPLVGPRRQSTTISVSLRAVMLLLVPPAVVVALVDIITRSALSAHLVHWCASTLLLLCALGLTVLGNHPQTAGRGYLLGVAALLALSLFEAAPRDIWPHIASGLNALHQRPFLTLVTGGTLMCAVIAIEAKCCEQITFSPALVTYLVGLVAAFLLSDQQPEPPFAGLLRSIANLGRLVGPALALRAMWRFLSPPDKPVALRFLLLPSLLEDHGPQTDRRH